MPSLVQCDKESATVLSSFAKSLIKQLHRGCDIHKISFPAAFLEPCSFLEKLTSIFDDTECIERFFGLNLLHRISSIESEGNRLLALAEYYMVIWNRMKPQVLDF